MQLLNTKFHIPVANGQSIIDRDILSGVKDNASKYRLVKVCAPAGFGKTTLVARWIKEKKLEKHTAWLSLDTRDNHPLKFWGYVIHAVLRAAPDKCTPALELLKCASGNDWEDIVIQLINCIERLETRLVLVLDDFHLIRDRQILNSLNFFIDHAIPNLLMVLVTRQSPRLNLSRLRLAGSLKEVTRKDLAFSPDETSRFLFASGQCIAPEAALSLNRLTEGWIAGLKLAILSLETCEDKNRAILNLSGNNRYILDYLVEEVMAGIDPTLKKFLTATSVAQRFNQDLCRELTGDDNAGQTLFFIEKRNLFLTPLDDNREWFRYHHLFRECLQKILKQEDKKKQQALRIKALDWFDQNGYPEEAFHMAVDSGNTQKAVTILAGITPELLNAGGEQFVHPFFSRLDENALLSNATLACYHFGFKIKKGAFDLIPQFALLQNSFHNNIDGVQKRTITGSYHFFKGYARFSVNADFSQTIVECQNALKILPREHTAFRQLAKRLLSLSYCFQGDIDKALALSGEHENKNLFMSVLSAVDNADQEFRRGNMSKARAILENKLEIVKTAFPGPLPHILGFVYTGLGRILRETNRLDEAYAMFATGLPLCRKSGFLNTNPFVYIEEALMYAAANDFSKAHASIDTAVRLCEKHASILLQMVNTWKARLYLLQDRAAFAGELAEKYPVKAGMNIPFAKSDEYIFLARYFIHIGVYAQALLVLDIMINQDREKAINGRLMECLILKAKSIFLQKKSFENARPCLEQAVDLAKDQGYVRLFLDEYHSVPALFHQAVKENILPRYLEEQIQAENNRGKHSPPNIETDSLFSVNAPGEKFNTREIDILVLMHQGATNREIAANLNITINTVKWYAREIYNKLDVKTRGKAVFKALDAGII